MYLIYSKNDGSVLRHVENYRVEPNEIVAGINGEFTLHYPNECNCDVFEIPDEEYNALDTANISKYMVVENTIVENPEWIDPSTYENMNRDPELTI